MVILLINQPDLGQVLLITTSWLVIIFVSGINITILFQQKGKMGNWIVLTVGTLVAIVVFRMKRPADETLETPSNFITFFHPILGEGDLFVGGVLVLYFSSRLFLALSQTIRSIF